jgi:hypothetical protein
MKFIKNIIRRVLLENDGEQLKIDFPTKLSVDQILDRIKKNVINKNNIRWYHTKSSGYSTNDLPQQQIPIYVKDVGEYPLLFRVDKFDPTVPVKVEYLGRSSVGKLYSEKLNNMDPQKFMEFINSEPFNKNFNYKVSPELDLTDIDRKIKPIFSALDIWLSRQPIKPKYHSTKKYPYSVYTDAHLIKRFLTEVYGLDSVQDKDVIEKLTSWYIRSKKLNKYKDIVDVDIKKHKENLRRFEFTIKKNNSTCDFELVGGILARDMNHAESLLRSGSKESIPYYDIKNLKCIDQFKVNKEDNITKLKPGYHETSYNYRWFKE